MCRSELTWPVHALEADAVNALEAEEILKGAEQHEAEEILVVIEDRLGISVPRPERAMLLLEALELASFYNPIPLSRGGRYRVRGRSEIPTWDQTPHHPPPPHQHRAAISSTSR